MIQQDQIFLHEDEDGQLYFKDDNGTLQPVYLTADGNYAIAENSSDEQEAQESTNNRQTSASPSSSIQASKNYDDDGFTVPDLDVRFYTDIIIIAIFRQLKLSRWIIAIYFFFPERGLGLESKRSRQ